MWSTMIARRVVVFCLGFVASFPVMAGMLSFDEEIHSARSFRFDSDGNGSTDVMFSTDDSYGIHTGPNPDLHVYILNGNVLFMPALLDPDIRIDFLYGAKDRIRFDFLLPFIGGLEFAAPGSEFEYTANVDLFDRNGMLIGSSTANAVLWAGFDAEGTFDYLFDGVAAYAHIDFVSYYSEARYLYGRASIMDNFAFTPAGTLPIIPEPTTVVLIMGGIAGVAIRGLGGSFLRQ